MKRKKPEKTKKTPQAGGGFPWSAPVKCAGGKRRVGPEPTRDGEANQEKARGRVASGAPPSELGPRRRGRAWGQDGRGFGSGGGSRGGNGLL